MTNPFEVAGRLEKAFKIALVLRKADISAADAKLMSEGEWIEVAHAAGCKPPSDETVRIAMEKLAGMEEFDAGMVA